MYISLTLNSWLKSYSNFQCTWDIRQTEHINNNKNKGNQKQMIIQWIQRKTYEENKKKTKSTF